MIRVRRQLQQPGPATNPRLTVQPCSVTRLELTLPAGGTVLETVAAVLHGRGIETAILEMPGAVLEPLAYVIPAESPDPDHVAWYSTLRKPEGRGRVEHAILSFGRDGAAPFLHCHGIWHHADGHRGGGHLLPDQSVLAEETLVQVWAIQGAGLARLPDPETNFSILMPVAQGAPDPQQARGLLVRIKPNFDLHIGLESAARAQGFSEASVHGVVSLVDCAFEDGQFMDSFASEGFIRQGRITGGRAELDLGLAAMSAKVFEGAVQRGGNGICIASELLIVETRA
jgi:predicted DNA-binding protein with PD1-like motif